MTKCGTESNPIGAGGIAPDWDRALASGPESPLRTAQMFVVPGVGIEPTRGVNPTGF